MIKKISDKQRILQLERKIVKLEKYLEQTLEQKLNKKDYYEEKNRDKEYSDWCRGL